METSTIKISKPLLHRLNRLKIDLSEYHEINCSMQGLADTAAEMFLSLTVDEIAKLLQERQG